jgi:hypothetical protein
MKRKTKEEYIIMLKDKYTELGRTPKIYEISCGRTISSVFGGWDKAISEAGLPVIEKWKMYSDEYLIEYIQNKAKELGRTPSSKEIKHDNIIKSRFGTWSNALKIAGLEPLKKSKSTENIRKEEMLILLNDYYKLYGKIPTQNDVNCLEYFPFTVRDSVKKFQLPWKEIITLINLDEDGCFIEIDELRKILIDECNNRKSFLSHEEIISFRKNNNIPSIDKIFKIFNVSNVYQLWYQLFIDVT